MVGLIAALKRYATQSDKTRPGYEGISIVLSLR
jgi:hypothetical protein